MDEELVDEQQVDLFSVCQACCPSWGMLDSHPDMWVGKSGGDRGKEVQLTLGGFQGRLEESQASPLTSDYWGPCEQPLFSIDKIHYRE